MTNRRKFLRQSTLALSSLVLSRAGFAQTNIGPAGLPAGALESATYDTLSGKLPLIKRTYRPPNFETPSRYFSEAFTPNDAFFVRYHLANIPRVDADTWKLSIAGDAIETPIEFTLDQLQKNFEAVEFAALCLCSGNRRGLSDPHVPGIQWGHGAMGNAKWKGVRLKDVLAKTGIKTGALEAAFDGADTGVTEKTPDFVKSLPMWKALDENTLIAWEMNGEPLPHWNGFPARLVVPGWTATYWVKHLTRIQILSQSFKGFWMSPGYRVPKGKFPLVDRFVSQESETNTPITEMVVNSLITNIHDRGIYKANSPLFVRGIAWDGGYGVNRVEVTVDGGKTWNQAVLGEDLGRYAWRQWSYGFVPQPGEHIVSARASNKLGATQTFDLIFNPAGYNNNVVQSLRIQVS